MNGEEFIRATRYGDTPVSTDAARGITGPPIEDPPHGELIRLPDPSPEEVARIDLSEAIELRRSVREFSTEDLSLSDLSYLLWCTAGITFGAGDEAFRTVPSAGCRHAIDTYIVAGRIIGLNPGLYRYIAWDHALEPIADTPDLIAEVQRSCFSQPFIGDAAVLFIWAAVAYRMTWKYGDRGFRNLFLDAGHICQNLYLAVQAAGCGTCAVGAFQDEKMNAILGLDGVEKFVLYLAAVGKTDEEEEGDQ